MLREPVVTRAARTREASKRLRGGRALRVLRSSVRDWALNAYQTSRTVKWCEKGHARVHARVSARVSRAPLLRTPQRGSSNLPYALTVVYLRIFTVIYGYCDARCVPSSRTARTHALSGCKPARTARTVIYGYLRLFTVIVQRFGLGSGRSGKNGQKCGPCGTEMAGPARPGHSPN